MNWRSLYDSPRGRGVCFGGGESSSSSSQATTNADNRAATGAPGSIAASGSAEVSGNTVINQSSDPTTILAALKSEESIAGSGLNLSAATTAEMNDLAQAAIGENAGLSKDAIDAWSQVIQQEQGVLGANNAALANIATEATSQVAPLQSSLKIVVVALAGVAMVFFLSRN